MPTPNSPRWAFWAAGAFFLLTWPAFYGDLPIARWLSANPLSGDFCRLVRWSELFAHGLGVAVIGLMGFVLDAQQRWRIPRLLASAYVPGILASMSKLIVARIRPGKLDLDSNLSETFVGWLPTVLGTPSGLDYGAHLQSLPSGHTATTVGLAIGLTHLYPQGRWLFVAFAVLAAFQRIHGASHYLSDTLVGAAIGFLGAALVLDSRLLGRWLNQLEGGLQNRVALRP